MERERCLEFDVDQLRERLQVGEHVPYQFIVSSYSVSYHGEWGGKGPTLVEKKLMKLPGGLRRSSCSTQLAWRRRM